jgi:hypothetical protein
MKRQWIAAGVVAGLLAGTIILSRAPAAAPPAAEAAVGSGTDAAAVRALEARLAALPSGPTSAGSVRAAKGTVVAQGKWGAAPGEFGRDEPTEANPEGPMAVTSGANGEVAVLDQLNRRVQRYRDGRLVGSLALQSDTGHDLALAPKGRIAVLDRLADRNVQLYDKDGKLLSSVPIEGKGLRDPGEATGLFADDSGIYVERDNASLVRVADADGNPDAARPELLGRPSLDGRALLQAEIVDHQGGIVLVRATDRATNRLAWVRRLPAGAPILELLLVDSDTSGDVYVAVSTGWESPADPSALTGEHIVALRLSATGAPKGMLTLPPLTSTDEVLRPLSVAAAGVIDMMSGSAGGLSVTRYRFD